MEPSPRLELETAVAEAAPRSRSGHVARDRLRQEVLSVYPRPAGDRSIADAIVAHATRSEAAAPPGSLAFELLRQHREAETRRRS